MRTDVSLCQCVRLNEVALNSCLNSRGSDLDPRNLLFFVSLTCSMQIQGQGCYSTSNFATVRCNRESKMTCKVRKKQWYTLCRPNYFIIFISIPVFFSHSIQFDGAEFLRQLLIVAHLVKIFPVFMELEGSLLHSQDPTTGLLSGAS